MSSAFFFGIDPFIQDSFLKSTLELGERVGGNTGNLAFTYALRRQLAVENVVPWSASVASMRAAGQLAIIPCANQVGPHLDMGGMAKKIAEARLNVVAIGLGAQAGLDYAIPEVPAGTKHWLREMRDAAVTGAPNIAVRGEFSRAVLESVGVADSVPLGCPSLFINPDVELGRNLKQRAKNVERIAVVSGHFRWRHLSTLEASLGALCEHSGGEYVVQSPVEMIALARGEICPGDTVFDACRDFVAPHLGAEGFRRWFSSHARTYFDAMQWLESMRRYDLVVGTRIHGVMFALQAGTPGICVAHDSRTLELCQTMQIPHFHAKDVLNGLSRSHLLARLNEVDWDAFDANRAKLLVRYVKFVRENGLETRHEWLGGVSELGRAVCAEGK